MISKTDNKIIFVTARNAKFKNITKQHFDDININFNKFESHFIESNNKGLYIRNNVDLHEYDGIIFIDDANHNLVDVKNEFGDFVDCYKFIIE